MSRLSLGFALVACVLFASCGDSLLAPQTSCDDAVANGSETDVDCGGGVCSACDLGQLCVDDVDCASGMCSAGECVGPGGCDEQAADVCGPGSCVSVGSDYRCDCDSGYEDSGITCVDVDECAALADNCSADAACTNSDGSFSCDCNVGFLGDGVACAVATSCLALLSGEPATPSGIYSIDPGSGAFDAYCDMTTEGGGWTLLATNNFDDSVWTAELITNAPLFGTVSTTANYKGPAWHLVPFSDVLFQNGSMYAVYAGVGDGSMAYNGFQLAVPADCAVGTQYEWPMTAGTFDAVTLCNTNLYINPVDWDGGMTCPSNSQHPGSGPTWSVGFNGGCPLAAPASSGFWNVDYERDDTHGDGHPWGDTTPLLMLVR